MGKEAELQSEIVKHGAQKSIKINRYLKNNKGEFDRQKGKIWEYDAYKKELDSLASKNSFMKTCVTRPGRARGGQRHLSDTYATYKDTSDPSSLIWLTHLIVEKENK
jgi:hypothetical protein